MLNPNKNMKGYESEESVPFEDLLINNSEIDFENIFNVLENLRQTFRIKKLIDYLEKVTQIDAWYVKLRNNKNYIQTWILYSHFVRDSEQVLEFALSKGVGKSNDLIYLSLFKQYEEKNEFTKALNTLMMGIQNNMEKDKLIENMKELEFKIEINISNIISRKESKFSKESNFIYKNKNKNKNKNNFNVNVNNSSNPMTSMSSMSSMSSNFHLNILFNKEVLKFENNAISSPSRKQQDEIFKLNYHIICLINKYNEISKNSTVKNNYNLSSNHSWLASSNFNFNFDSNFNFNFNPNKMGENSDNGSIISELKPPKKPPIQKMIPNTSFTKNLNKMESKAPTSNLNFSSDDNLEESVLKNKNKTNPIKDAVKDKDKTQTSKINYNNNHKNGNKNSDPDMSLNIISDLIQNKNNSFQRKDKNPFIKNNDKDNDNDKDKDNSIYTKYKVKNNIIKYCSEVSIEELLSEKYNKIAENSLTEERNNNEKEYSKEVSCPIVEISSDFKLYKNEKEFNIGQNKQNIFNQNIQDAKNNYNKIHGNPNYTKNLYSQSKEISNSESLSDYESSSLSSFDLSDILIKPVSFPFKDFNFNFNSKKYKFSKTKTSMPGLENTFSSEEEKQDKYDKQDKPYKEVKQEKTVKKVKQAKQAKQIKQAKPCKENIANNLDESTIIKTRNYINSFLEEFDDIFSQKKALLNSKSNKMSESVSKSNKIDSIITKL